MLNFGGVPISSHFIPLDDDFFRIARHKIFRGFQLRTSGLLMHIGGKCILDFQDLPLVPAVSSGDVFVWGF